MDSQNTDPTISKREAYLFWLKLGFISFGGPAGQIAIMHQELVDKRRWISEKRFIHALNYCMLLPGPEAQQLATYIGWLMHRTTGGIIAGGLFVLPSLFLLVLLSWIYVSFGEVAFIAGIFYGIKSAVVAIVLQATYRIASRTLKNPLLWIIAAGAFLGLFTLDLPFPLIVLFAALIGAVGGKFWPAYFHSGGGHAASAQAHSPAVIDDDSPLPDHAIFNLPHFIKVCLVGLALWVSVISALAVNWGWHGTFTQMAWFFTKAALLTFGGAYAVLPYVFQGGVEQYGWLTAAQMMDGLALGESTPGPLIMVVSFVAFLGGYNTVPLGPEYATHAGIIAACIVTYFTFLPSFIFILAGAPFIETTHGNLRFTAPLGAITAAVVGVVFNLAIFFAYHILWPTGLSGHFDWTMLLMTLASVILLFYFKRNVMEVIGVMGGAGLLVSMAFG